MQFDWCQKGWVVLLKVFFFFESFFVNILVFYRWVDGMFVCVVLENRLCFLDKKEIFIEIDLILCY